MPSGAHEGELATAALDRLLKRAGAGGASGGVGTWAKMRCDPLGRGAATEPLRETIHVNGGEWLTVVAALVNG